MTNPLDYQSAAVPEDCKFKISPSGFSDFISAPHRWYRSQVSKVEVFEGNTSSVIGTIVHYIAETVAQNKTPQKDMIEEYIVKMSKLPDVDGDVVRDNFPMMAEMLINEYVWPNKSNYLSVETQHCAKIAEGVYAAGTLDVLEGVESDCMITDYKTYNSKTKPKTIPANYKYQLLVYAHMLMLNGYSPTRIRLVYVSRNIDGGLSEKTGKPLKSYPPEVTVLTELITQEDMDFIKSCLDLCVDTLAAGEAHPELLHVMWHDPRLKPGAENVD